MSELTKLEQLEKNVVDTKAAYDVASADYAAWGASSFLLPAWTAHRKALQELEDYLKEQD